MAEARSYDYIVQYEVRVRVNVNAATPEAAAREARMLGTVMAEVIDPRGGMSLIKLVRCTGCEHGMDIHDTDGRCWFTVESGQPGANLVCPCKIREDT